MKLENLLYLPALGKEIEASEHELSEFLKYWYKFIGWKIKGEGTVLGKTYFDLIIQKDIKIGMFIVNKEETLGAMRKHSTYLKYVDKLGIVSSKFEIIDRLYPEYSKRKNVSLLLPIFNEKRKCYSIVSF